MPHPDGLEEQEAVDASPRMRILAAMAAIVAALGSRITIIATSTNKRVGMSRSSSSSTSSRNLGHSSECRAGAGGCLSCSSISDPAGRGLSWSSISGPNSSRFVATPGAAAIVNSVV